MESLTHNLGQWDGKNTLKFCHCYPSNNKFNKTLKRLLGIVKRKGKLLTSVLWKPFNSHCIAHVIKVPAFKINRCTIWSYRSTKVIYKGSNLLSEPFINVSGNKFHLNTDEFTSGSSKLRTFSATGTPTPWGRRQWGALHGYQPNFSFGQKLDFWLGLITRRCIKLWWVSWLFLKVGWTGCKWKYCSW